MQDTSVQHNPTYKAVATESAKDQLRDDLFSFLDDKLEPRYRHSVSDEEHYSNIEELMAFGTKMGAKILQGGTYKVSNAQKLLNLYLKYLWCTGIVEVPPQCPIDRIVLEKAGILDVKWTKLKTIKDYRAVVTRLKKAVGNSLAPWELESYSRRLPHLEK
jgi:hypothetical protein